MKTIFQALRLLLLLSVLTGIAYPLLVTGIARIAFPRQAGGSLIHNHGKLIGSDLLAQNFEDPRYFAPRPSAAAYATVASGASNKGPASADLAKAIGERRDKLGEDAPGDLLTASASGLDPHISPAAARFQAERVATARRLPLGRVEALIGQSIEAPQFGFLGEPRINVLRLNRLLDQTP